MIRRNLASLSISSERRTVAEITERIGVYPSRFADTGQLTRQGVNDRRNVPPEYRTYSRTHWSLDADESLMDPDDETGFSAVRVLMDAVRDSAAAIAEMAATDSEVVVVWSGYSDSFQGGFVIPPDLVRDLAAIGAELYGTAYLDDDEEEDEDDDDDDDDEPPVQLVRVDIGELRSLMAAHLRDRDHVVMAALGDDAAAARMQIISAAQRALVGPPLDDGERDTIRSAVDRLTSANGSATGRTRLVITRLLMIAELAL
jgi:hypothetical protein